MNLPRRDPADSLWRADRRALTIGLVLTITLIGFESLAISTVMPIVADELGGIELYGWVFSAFFLGSLIGMTVEIARDSKPTSVIVSTSPIVSARRSARHRLSAWFRRGRFMGTGWRVPRGSASADRREPGTTFVAVGGPGRPGPGARKTCSGASAHQRCGTALQTGG